MGSIVNSIELFWAYQKLKQSGKGPIFPKRLQIINHQADFGCSIETTTNIPFFISQMHRDLYSMLAWRKLQDKTAPIIIMADHHSDHRLQLRMPVEIPRTETEFMFIYANLSRTDDTFILQAMQDDLAQSPYIWLMAESYNSIYRNRGAENTIKGWKEGYTQEWFVKSRLFKAISFCVTSFSPSFYEGYILKNLTEPLFWWSIDLDYFNFALDRDVYNEQWETHWINLFNLLKNTFVPVVGISIHYCPYFTNEKIMEDVPPKILSDLVSSGIIKPLD